MRTRIENVFPVSPDTFWNVLFFDTEYNARLYEQLGFDSVTVTSLVELGEGKLRRTLRAEPPVRHAPDFLRKKLQQKLSYEEEGVFDPKAQRWDFTNSSPVAPPSSRIGGSITSAPHPEGMLHIVELELHISALGLGGMVEKAIEKNVRESYGVTLRFTHEYAREKGLLFGPTSAANTSTLHS